MKPIPLCELREMRTIGQEFLHPGGSICGFTFPVKKVSRIDIDDIAFELRINENKTELKNMTIQLESDGELNSNLIMEEIYLNTAFPQRMQKELWT